MISEMVQNDPQNQFGPKFVVLPRLSQSKNLVEQNLTGNLTPATATAQRPRQDVLQLKVEEEKPVDDEEPDPDEPFNFKIWSEPPPEPWICC